MVCQIYCRHRPRFAGTSPAPALPFAVSSITHRTVAAKPTSLQGFRFPILGIRSRYVAYDPDVTLRVDLGRDPRPSQRTQFRVFSASITTCSPLSLLLPLRPPRKTLFGIHDRVYNLRRTRAALGFRDGYDLSAWALTLEKTCSLSKVFS